MILGTAIYKYKRPLVMAKGYRTASGSFISIQLNICSAVVRLERSSNTELVTVLPVYHILHWSDAGAGLFRLIYWHWLCM